MVQQHEMLRCCGHRRRREAGGASRPRGNYQALEYDEQGHQLRELRRCLTAMTKQQRNGARD